MAKKKKKRRSLLATLLDGVLSLIDFLCEGVANACILLFRGISAVLYWLARGVWAAVMALLRAVWAVPCWILRKLTAKRNRASCCLKLDGPEFEAYVALVLKDNGFRHVELTKGSGDQGADILAERNGRSYAIQCKNYEGAVGNFAVQEALIAPIPSGNIRDQLIEKRYAFTPSLRIRLTSSLNL